MTDEQRTAAKEALRDELVRRGGSGVARLAGGMDILLELLLSSLLGEVSSKTVLLPAMEQTRAATQVDHDAIDGQCATRKTELATALQVLDGAIEEGKK